MEGSGAVQSGRETQQPLFTTACMFCFISPCLLTVGRSAGLVFCTSVALPAPFPPFSVLQFLKYRKGALIATQKSLVGTGNCPMYQEPNSARKIECQSRKSKIEMAVDQKQGNPVSRPLADNHASNGEKGGPTGDVFSQRLLSQSGPPKRAVPAPG